MIALNARMYAVAPAAASVWRELLECIARRAGIDATWLDHPAPAPLDALWRRADLGAAFMCGLPYSRAANKPILLAVPVPANADYADSPCYWSEMVVAASSRFQRLEDTFGGRMAFTTAGSQSGFAAPLALLEELTRAGAPPEPLYSHIVGPVVTPPGAVAAVADGAADIAPVDSYAFALLRRFAPESTARVRSIARTAATPIPPLIAAPEALPAASLQALREAFITAHHHDDSASLLQALLLRRFAIPEPLSYEALSRRFDQARAFWSQHRLASTVAAEFVMTT